MTRYGQRTLIFAAALSALAGFTDAVGFIGAGGLFVSFMSGNTTRMGVATSEAQTRLALAALGLIGCFVLGVVAASLFRGGSRRNPQSRLLFAVSGLLAISAVVIGPSRSFGLALLAVAMGALNQVLEGREDAPFGVTYMTGSLVKMGVRLAGCIRNGFDWSWAPYALLWAGLAAGAFVGAAAYQSFGPSCLWFAALFGMVNAAISFPVHK